MKAIDDMCTLAATSQEMQSCSSSPSLAFLVQSQGGDFLGLRRRNFVPCCSSLLPHTEFAVINPSRREDVLTILDEALTIIEDTKVDMVEESISSVATPKQAEQDSSSLFPAATMKKRLGRDTYPQQ